MLVFAKPSKESLTHQRICVSAGRLSYDVNTETKEVAVSVSDMLQGHDYHLRLCRKDFICTGTGAKALVSVSCGVEKALFLNWN